MTNSMNQVLAGRLDQLRSQNLLRVLRQVDSPQIPRALLEGAPVLNFSSNDYLGLASHPELIEASAQAMARFGFGSGASRLISGSLGPHQELEKSIARFKRTEAALVFSSGYATALGAITSLVTRNDIIIIDRLAHASIVDAARLSGAVLRVFPHNDCDALEKILARYESRDRDQQKILIVTESLFSMDGDIAPLKELVELKERFGAWLMVDEAHATGLFGETRGGLVQQFGLTGAIEVQMGTLGKAVGGAGGFIAGSEILIQYLVNRARSFIFSTAMPPANSAAAAKGLDLIAGPVGQARLERLRRNIALFSDLTGRPPAAQHSPIFPWMLGAEEKALDTAARLRELGIFVPAIRYPSVGLGEARLRITFSAAHSLEEVERLANAIKKAG